MANTTPCWRPMDGQLPITGAGLPLTAAFCPAPTGMLGIRLLSGGSFPGGRLVLIAKSKSQTDHWYQDAAVADGVLQIPMEGFEAAAARCSDAEWSLSLGQVTGEGITLRRLRRKGLQKRLDNRNLYFHDDRDLTAEPPCRFSKDGQTFAVFPLQLGRDGTLLLQVSPAERRYERTAACRLSRLERQGTLLHLSVRCPKTLPQPVGFSLLATVPNGADSTVFVPAEPEGDFSQSRTVSGALDLSALRPQPGLWQLTCVLDREGDLLLHVPLHLTDRQAAVTLSETLEGRPACQVDGRNCTLSIDLRHRPILSWPQSQPGGQLFPPESGVTTLADFLPRVQRAPEGLTCSARHVGGGGWQWQFRLPSRDFSDADELALLLVHDKDNSRLICPVTPVESDGSSCTLSADLSALKDTVESCRRVNWQVTLLARQKTTFYALPLADPGRTPQRNKRQQTQFNFAGGNYDAPIGALPFAGHTVELTPFCTFKGAWQLSLADQCLRYYSHFDCRAVSAGIRFGRLHLKVTCPPVEGGQWVGVVLTHRYQLESDRAEHYFPLNSLRQEGDHFLLTASVKLKQFSFSPLYWDIRVVFEREGVRYWSSVKAPFRSQRHYWREIAWKVGLKGLFFGESTRLDQDNQLFLYRTVGNRFALVCQEYSPYTGFRFRLKERFAMVLYYLFRKRLLQKSIYLTYEKYCCMAQDNGFYFFQYCMDHDMESVMNRKIYFVIDKKQPDYQNLLPYQDHVIQFMSLKHMVYLLAARLLISSDSKAHSYAWRAKESVILPLVTKNKRLVFLQHGVIALKRVEFYRSGTNSVNLFVTSNDQEHDIIINELGYLPEEVIVTGLARWDVLKDCSDRQPNTHILVMPTWRNWLEEVSDETFMASDYYQNYMALLNSDRLAAYLERYDVYLDFYIHPKFREYIKNFSISGERVRLIPFGSQPLNQLMMECRLLVTDYSSVCWDVYYQGKPVLFYQFDVEQYNETQGAYIDLEKDLFGDRATTPEELFALLEEAAENGFQLKPKYADMRESRYKYLDHNNSRRTCQEIMKRNW